MREDFEQRYSILVFWVVSTLQFRSVSELMTLTFGSFTNIQIHSGPHYPVRFVSRGIIWHGRSFRSSLPFNLFLHARVCFQTGGFEH